MKENAREIQDLKINDIIVLKNVLCRYHRRKPKSSCKGIKNGNNINDLQFV